MKHRDLGVLDDPLILFGGPYSNAHAMRALKGEAERMDIPPERMISTGDIVAYAGQPAQTVGLVRALGCPVVAGNCEVQLGSGAQDCGCGFEEGTTCDLLSAAWFNFAAQALDDESKSWMVGLPDVITFRHRGARYGVIHGGVEDIARFIWSTSGAQVFEVEWRALEKIAGRIDHVIAGHSGIPFVRDLARGRWINAGVIGMPPHDGRPETRFATLDRGEVEIHRLSYDAAGAAAAVQAAGLPDGYRAGLLSGYWPSEDVLPAALRVPSRASG